MSYARCQARRRDAVLEFDIKPKHNVNVTVIMCIDWLRVHLVSESESLSEFTRAMFSTGLVVVAALVSGSAGAPPSKPHILMILVDVSHCSQRLLSNPLHHVPCGVCSCTKLA